jgi:hypothetical protein
MCHSRECSKGPAGRDDEERPADMSLSRIDTGIAEKQTVDWVLTCLTIQGSWKNGLKEHTWYYRIMEEGPLTTQAGR